MPPFTASGTVQAAVRPLALTVDAVAADWQVVLQLRTLIERNPGLVTLLLGERSGAGGTPAEAVYAAAREARTTCPERADVHYYAAVAALHVGRGNEAEALLIQTLRLDGQHAAALLSLSELLLGRGQLARAASLLEQACASEADERSVRALRERIAKAQHRPGGTSPPQSEPAAGQIGTADPRAAHTPETRESGER